MAKRNYNNMYKEETREVAPAEELVVEEASAKKDPDDVDVAPKVKKEISPTKPFMGVVIGEYNLNVRKTPNGEIFTTIRDGAQVRVIDASNPEWYKIESPEGFVMKKYIKKA